MINLTPTLSHGDRICLQALRDLAAKAGGSHPALLLTTIVDYLGEHAKRLATLELREASLPGLVGHMIRLHLEGSVDLEAMKPTADAKLTALQLAIRFHETYERLAPSFGYETRTDTRQFDPESKNGRLMVAVCGELAGLVPAAPQVATGELQGELAEIVSRVRETERYMRLNLAPNANPGLAITASVDPVQRIGVSWDGLLALCNAIERGPCGYCSQAESAVERAEKERDSAREAERGALVKLAEAQAESTNYREAIRRWEAPTPAAPCAESSTPVKSSFETVQEMAAYMKGVGDGAKVVVSVPDAPTAELCEMLNTMARAIEEHHEVDSIDGDAHDSLLVMLDEIKGRLSRPAQQKQAEGVSNPVRIAEVVLEEAVRRAISSGDESLTIDPAELFVAAMTALGCAPADEESGR